MKALKNFITESAQPEFVKKVIELAKKEGIETKIENMSENDKLVFIPPKYRYSQVGIVWKNGGKLERIPRTLYSSSQFDNEPLYIKITGWDVKEDSQTKLLSKDLFNNLSKDGLTEATNGKNPQWGTWKFAIRSEEDENKVLKHLKSYLKALKKAKN